MGLFDKLGKGLSGYKGLDVEEYMNSAEMRDVDLMNEPADFYIKPVMLKEETDVSVIEGELNKRNIVLLNVADMSKRPNTLKKIVETLKDFVDKTGGDIAMISADRMLLTPSKVKIVKSKKG
ncbi:MAG: cell division protein SepF [Candidatus Marsarchaeota archaeon]|jgi:SepF-like predicted cell division protein (DUF552 family)|nr:cell division protein SepF [Candidatus Marsarchaeota archaeon]